MMRLPKFKYLAPKKASEVVKMLAGEGPTAMVVAGGTDLYPNMKRRHQMPKTLIGLRGVKELRGIDKLHVKPGTFLSEIERDKRIQSHYPAFWKSVVSISTPILRNMGTIGGNLCLDTRCNYYNQNYEWRRAIHFCMKCEGKTCWVAPSSDRCLAVQSSDTAPVMCALGAKLTLLSKDGERRVEAKDFYQNDGISYLRKRPDELLVDIELPATNGASTSLGTSWRATYWKLRRRGAFDFPVLGVAIRLETERETVKDARIFLGAVSSWPVEAKQAQQALIGQRLTDENIKLAADLAFPPAKAMDNTDYDMHWRKEMARQYVKGALTELR